MTGIIHHTFDIAEEEARAMIARGTARKVWIVRVPWAPDTGLPHTGGCYCRTDAPPTDQTRDHKGRPSRIVLGVVQ